MHRSFALAVSTLVACSSPSTPAPTLVANRSTATPLLVATPLYPSGLVIAAVSDDAPPRTVLTVPGVSDFGWTDERTLFALDDMGNETATLELVRVVDTRITDRVTVSDKEWSSASLHLSRTGGGTAWAGRCKRYDDESSPPTCADAEYLRLWPAPQIRSTEEPPSEIPAASAYTANAGWPLPPTTAAPPGVKLSKTSRTATADYGSTRDIDIHICERGGERREYPLVDDWDVAYGFRVDGARWISTTPPIYELRATVNTPVDIDEEQRIYMKPCEPPMSNFVWLGANHWAAFAEPPDADAYGQIQREADYDKRLGTWTFYAGDRELGTLRGLDALRANRF